MTGDRSTICPICKKQRAADAPGSLTSFLFQEMRCTCDASGAAEIRHAGSDFTRCKDCGRIELERVGSFTSFLFQDLCCNCSNGELNHTKGRNEQLLNTRFQRTDRSTKSSALGSTRRWQRNDSDAMTELQEGEVIGGYRLLKQIGRGGMGVVFLAEYLTLNRICALKFLAPSMVSDKSWIMFQNEAKIVAGLSHPTICQIYDMGVHDSRLPFYAMEFLEGESLESILFSQRTLTIGAALEVFSKVADGLSYAHRHGVVHKDIKPANIMLTPTADGNAAVKILDFGIAELVDKQREERAPGDIVGSAYYMSPEQFNGTKLDQRSDIYSVGCALFETLTGEPPFQDDFIEGLLEKHCNENAPRLEEKTDIKFPDELEELLQKTLAKSPEERYQSADQLVEDIEQLLTSKELVFVESPLEDTSIRTISPPTQASLAGHWGVALVLVGTGACLALGYLAVSFFVQSMSNDSSTPSNPAHLKASKSKHKTDASKDSQVSENQSVGENPDKNFFDTLNQKAERYTLEAAEPKGFIKAGMALAQADEPARSLNQINKGLQLNPKLWTVEVSDSLVKDYIDLGQFKNALTESERGLKQTATHYRWRTKGQILSQLNRSEEAIQCFDVTIKLAPNEYWNYFDRGSCYLGLNQTEKALADFTKLISMRPDEARGYSLRAKCYERLGKPELAAFDIKKAEQLARAEMD